MGAAPGPLGRVEADYHRPPYRAPRSVIIGYVEDGAALVSLAMNGWGAAEPAWWLNLQSESAAVVELRGGE